MDYPGFIDCTTFDSPNCPLDKCMIDVNGNCIQNTTTGPDTFPTSSSITQLTGMPTSSSISELTGMPTTSTSLLHDTFEDSINQGSLFQNYFQGGFCKYQEELGYYVGCSDHIYDNSFINLDRELDSVNPGYSILSSS